MKKATSLSILAAAILAAPVPGQTPGFSTVVEFTGTSGAKIGSEPAAALMEHSDGNLYGTTLSGGPGNLGTIYKLTKAGVFTNLKSLTGATGTAVGFYPWCTLAESSDGTLFGVNQGNNSGITANGFGNTFKITTSGAYTSFFAFSGQGQPNRGQNPRGGFLRVGNEFYGTTVVGGTSSNHGTVFKTSTSGFNTYLLDFTFTGVSNRGSQPNARLLNGNDGFLYGSTYTGGTGEFGTLFRINISTGILTTLVEFTGNASPNPGKYPADALILASDGNLYGTTANGGISRDTGGVLYNAGTVFRYNPSTGAFATVVEFTGGTGIAQGAGPFGGLVQGPDGFLYGVTQYLGPGTTGNGTIYRVSLTGSMNHRLVDFTSAVGPHKGEQPYGGLMKTSEGIIYGTTLYGGSTDRGTIWKLDTTLLPKPPTVTTGTATSITNTSVVLNGTVNPNSLATDWQFEYGTSTAYGAVIPVTAGSLAAGTAAVPVSTSLSGLTNNTTYHFRLRAASNAGITNGANGTFTTGTGNPQAPIVVTGTATGVSGTAATLNGTVNPQGNAASWQFEYGPTTSYGSVAPVAAGTTGSGSAAEAVSTNLTGLPGGTTIHYRLKATNTGGTVTGSDQTFTTTGTPQPPLAITGAATDITGTSAVLNGTVNPRGSDTTWQFSYGPTVTANAFTVPIPAGSIDGGFSVEPVSISILGLTPGSTVYYRLTASNTHGPGTGTTGSFVTATAPTVVTQAAADVGNTSATLVGTVNPHGNSASWQFEFGPDTNYGTLVPAAPGSTGNGNAPELVTFTLTNLTPGATIHYRLRAENGAGTSTGADFAFTTKQAPTVTAVAQNITAGSATLAGTVNPHGVASTWQFDYGTTVSYGTSVPAVAGTTGTGTAPVAVSFPLTGLLPNTTYHFRLRASSANGATTGPDVTFTTNNNVAGWRQIHFGTMNNTGNAANLADPDKDGVLNVMEYGFGMNPNQYDRHLLPVPSYNGSSLIASFASPAGINDIVYGAEVSTNLDDWSPLADGGAGLIHNFISPISPDDKSYMRVRVTLIP
jgi:uncharacterized repeat protein (TIGR03803 family)